jgi:hypothetical protein
MGACRNLARCRGIADKVGSHRVDFTLIAASLAVVGSRFSGDGCLP